MNNEQRQDWPRPAQEADEAQASLMAVLGSDAVHAIRELAEAVVADALAQERYPDPVEAENSRFREENSRLRGQLDIRTAKLRDLDDEILTLEAENSNLRQKVEDLTADVRAWDEDAQVLHDKLMARSLQVEDLEKKLEGCNEDIETLDEENAVLHEKVMSLVRKAEYDGRLIDRLKNPANWRVKLDAYTICQALSMCMTGKPVEHVDTEGLAYRLSAMGQVEYDPRRDDTGGEGWG